MNSLYFANAKRCAKLEWTPLHMKVLLTLIAFNALLFLNAGAQKIDGHGISLLNGLNFQTANLTVPWGTTFDEIKKYGNPKIFCSTKTNTKILWDSIYILDSIKVSFWTFYSRCFEKHNPKRRLNTIYGSIDSVNIFKLKTILENYSNTPATLFKSKNSYTYSWIIDNCNVKLGYRKNGDSFFDIQTKNKTFW